MTDSVTPGSGEEGRIYAEYHGKRKRLDYSREGLPGLRMYLARKWKRPVREIKRISRLKP